MTLLELVKYLRISLLDDGGGTGVEWADITEDDDEHVQFRWTNEELTKYIDLAQKQVARTLLCFKSDDPQFAIDIVADTAEYLLNTDIIKVKDMYLNSTGKVINKSELEDFAGLSHWRTRTGAPSSAIVDENTGKIRLYPIPIENDTLNLIVYHLPLTTLDWELAETQSLEIREEYQIPMLYWAAYLAYQKDEANALDPEASLKMRSLFEQEFGINTAKSETKQRRSRNRRISYGGIPQSLYRVRNRGIR